VGNLEVPLGGGERRYTGYPAFSAPDELADALKDAGFDLLFTANNHCLDRGGRGALRTLAALESRDLAYTGTSPAEPDPASTTPPALLSADGVTFAFLSYTYGTNGIRIPPGIRVNLTDPERIAADVRTARASSPDFVVVALHCGREYRTSPDPSQVAAVRAALSAGATIVLGGHPHVLQRVDILSPDRTGGSPRVVAWSLGNFLSSQRTVPRDRGALLEIRIDRGADGTARISRVAAVPLKVRYDRVGGRRRIEVRPIPGRVGPHSAGTGKASPSRDRDGPIRGQVLDLLTRGAKGQTRLRLSGDRWILYEAPTGAFDPAP
jgi:poly-gamma-glutamate synthesis protein (capsule biosynthesis protein)